MPRHSPDTTAPSLAALLETFAERRVLVVGDVILDHYVRGVVTRVSPEAPVPVLTVEQDEYLLGGAGNVAQNLAALGARVELVGLCGEDTFASRLEELAAVSGRLQARLVRDPARPTTRKTRCVAGGQQMLRLDREIAAPASAAVAKKLRAAAQSALRRVDGVIVSDYGKGVLGPEVLPGLLALARDAGKPVFVDPKGYDYRRYEGATYLTPNQKEAQEASGVLIADEAALAEAGRRLLRQVRAEAVFITRGPKGVSVFPKRGAAVHLPARAREVFDVTGAGDTFIAVSTLARLGGGSLEAAAHLGNTASGIVVGKVGVATVDRSEIARELLAEERTPSP
ncbi:MAG: D-glycero-beta-D-manno-heptose-7-phosphate kinase [Candidatus Sumerlaeia bacterium]|nr:D-glycero-beta-D-manno-heptose-7-phosphate kinase [Candidatus Sumerlaeia bacterium]